MKKIIIIVVAVVVVLGIGFFMIGSSTPSGTPWTPSVGPTPTPSPTPTSTDHTGSVTSPTGKILYVVDKNHERFVTTMNADGTGVKQLASCGMGECYASWSPDGTKITFERSIDGVAIYTMNADGSNVKRLSPTPGQDVRPSYSADGKKIVFTHVVKASDTAIPETEINTMNTDGSGITTIVPSAGAFNVEARFSPDGSKLVFMRGISGVGQHVYTVNADGTGLKQLTREGANGDPNWSSDGSRISFGSNREGGGKLNVFTMKADGSDVRQITHFKLPYEAGDTTWSPDDKYIAFEWDVDGKGQSDPNARAEVWIVPSDGSGEPKSTGQACSAVGCAPRWMPEN